MDLDELIKQVIIIDKELDRRKENDHLSNYNTGNKVHKKQLLFHKSKKKNRWVFGGNRSGKSQCGAVEAVWLARGIHPYKDNKACDGWVVSLSQQVQRDVTQNKILYYLNPDWIESIVMLSGRKDSAENGVIDYILIKNVLAQQVKLVLKHATRGVKSFKVRVLIGFGLMKSLLLISIWSVE